LAELPSGTVTFLFSDIEGSTRLLRMLGDSYRDVLEQHQRLLRKTFEDSNGQEIDTQGDSFFVAFARARDAVAAAVAAQRALASHQWPPGAELRVRIGLHTGEPTLGEGRYVGLGVHRAARIMAAGHGGQVLLSNTTRELVEDELPEDVRLRDLGDQRLKDLDRPERIFQLEIDALPKDFPPLRTDAPSPAAAELAEVVTRRRLYRRPVTIAALAGVVAAAIAIPIFVIGRNGSEGGLTVEGNAVALIDPQSDRLVGQVPVGIRPAEIASGSGSIWVANLDDQTVQRIDPAARRVIRTLPVGDTPTGLATSNAAVWVVGANSSHFAVTVKRIDPQFDVVVHATRLGNVIPGGAGSLATRQDAVWVAPSSGLLTRLDSKTSRVLQTIDPNAGPSGIGVGSDAVWLTDSRANTVTRVDPTGLLTPIAVGRGPSGIAVGAGGVWVADSLDDAVVRIDPHTRAVTTTIPVGRSPLGVAVGAGSVWVANSRDGTVTRIDPTTGKAEKTIEVGGAPQAIVVAAGRVWVTVQPRTIVGSPSGSPGGTARLNAENDMYSTDPALAFDLFSWQLLYATCAGLLNYPDRPAPAGSQLEPEVAQSLPTRSADGKTYTFRIRKGFRFSPPSNAPVTAETFKYAIERSLSPRLGGPAPGFLGDISGADAYLAGRTKHVAGITARGSTLEIDLVAAVPDFPTRIAMPPLCAVPIGTPFKEVRTISSAGPYYVASYTPGQRILLERNPNYEGNRPHRLKRIELTIKVSKQQTVAQIEAGSVDYALDGIPLSDAPRLATRYGSGSPAAKKSRQQYFLNPRAGLDFLALNTHRPLFRDVRLRRAVNYAIDRRALARIGSSVVPGPGDRVTDHYLPPAIPGFRNARIYPLDADVARARRLTGGRRTHAVLYACNKSPCDRLAQVVKTNLAAIGMDVDVKAFPFPTLFERWSRKGEPFDLVLTSFFADYADPFNVLKEIRNASLPSFDDPVYARKLATAERLSGPVRYLTYGDLDVDLAGNAAPWVAYGNPLSHDFFSARMGCQVYHPLYGMDLAALCLRH
jgi:YVTN family beta-propeller protein